MVASSASHHPTSSPRFLTTPSPRSRHLRTPVKASPCSPHRSRDGGKNRSPTSLSLVGSLVRALKVKPMKKKTPRSAVRTGTSSPLLNRRRSMSGFGPLSTAGWEPVRSVYVSPQRDREMMIEEKRRRFLGKRGPGATDNRMASSDDEDDEQEDETDTHGGPVQYLYVPARRASIGSSPILTPRSMSSLHIDPFRTPPCTPVMGVPMENVCAFSASEFMDCVGATSSALLSAVDNTMDPERMRRRAEKSRMKSLQILGPEAAEAIRDFE